MSWRKGQRDIFYWRLYPLCKRKEDNNVVVVKREGNIVAVKRGDHVVAGQHHAGGSNHIDAVNAVWMVDTPQRTLKMDCSTLQSHSRYKYIFTFSAFKEV